jgi:hypothetical protein
MDNRYNSTAVDSRIDEESKVQRHEGKRGIWKA